MKTKLIMMLAISAASLPISSYAAVTTIPQSALIPSTTLYTTDVGGGIGTPLTMTGGGSVANIGGQANDDGFSGPIDLGFSLNFFGNTYTQFWANNNGNISFNEGIDAFTPEGPQGAPQPIVSPFFADVDTRGTNSGLMHLRQEPNQFIVTWDRVGYFDEHSDLLNTFQLVLRGPDYAVPAGEGQIGFFWTTMQWETGDASNGVNGFGGFPAAVGFGDGLNNGFILEGSTANGISSVVQNHRLWFDLTDEGTPAPVVPVPPAAWLLGSGLIGLFGLTRQRSQHKKVK